MISYYVIYYDHISKVDIYPFNTGKCQMSAITRLGTDQNKHYTYLPVPKQLSVLILLIVYIRLHSENNN